jgi:hypothetical protein
VAYGKNGMSPKDNGSLALTVRARNAPVGERAEDPRNYSEVEFTVVDTVSR